MRHRLREPVIPDDDAPASLAQRRTRWAVRVRTVAYVLVGLAVAASLMSVYLTYEAAQDSAAQAAAVDRRLAVLEDDLAERTRQRDEERDAAAARAAEDREQFRARFCEVLAELSASFPNLDRLREVLGCPQPATVEPSVSPGVPGADPAPGTPPALSAPPSQPPPSPPAAEPTAAPPSEPPDGPGLLCRLLPPLC